MLNEKYNIFFRLPHTQGVAQNTASSFIAATYLGIAKDAQTAVESEADGFDALIAEQGPNSNMYQKNPLKKESPKNFTCGKQT